MKISLNWIKEILDFDLTAEETSEILTDIGLEVEKSELYENIKGGLNGIVVGEIKKCEKHPNADKLKITHPLVIPVSLPRLSGTVPLKSL